MKRLWLALLLVLISCAPAPAPEAREPDPPLPERDDFTDDYNQLRHEDALATAEKYSFATVLRVNLNMREWPGPTYPVVRELYQGEEGAALFYNETREWVHVAFDGVFGWVPAKDVRLTNADTLDVIFVTEAPPPP